MRKPQCTGVHGDFRIKRNAEIALLSPPCGSADNVPLVWCAMKKHASQEAVIANYVLILRAF